MAMYDYQCRENHVTSVMLPMTDELPKTLICEECGEIAYRKFSSNIIIPEHFKAGSEICGGDSYASSDNLKASFSHASRPSGKGKIYY